MIIHEENHACTNQFVVDVKKVYIIKISENSSGNFYVVIVRRILHTHNQCRFMAGIIHAS